MWCKNHLCVFGCEPQGKKVNLYFVAKKSFMCICCKSQRKSRCAFCGEPLCICCELQKKRNSVRF
jgi:hypothetical protein